MIGGLLILALVCLCWLAVHMGFSLIAKHLDRALFKREED